MFCAELVIITVELYNYIYKLMHVILPDLDILIHICCFCILKKNDLALLNSCLILNKTRYPL